MKKYLLEEIILDHNNDLIEFGHDHCIEKWDQLPEEIDILIAVNRSIDGYRKNKNVNFCTYNFYEADVDEDGYTVGEWKRLEEYQYDLKLARVNADVVRQYHKEFISFVESCDSWSDVEAYEYIDHLEDLNLDYHKYDDPDMMWADYLKAVEALDVNIEEA